MTGWMASRTCQEGEMTGGSTTPAPSLCARAQTLPQNRCSRLLYHSPAIRPHNSILWLLPANPAETDPGETAASTGSPNTGIGPQDHSKVHLKELDHVELRVGLLLLCGSFTKQLSRIHLVPVVVFALKWERWELNGNSSVRKQEGNQRQLF